MRALHPIRLRPALAVLGVSAVAFGGFALGWSTRGVQDLDSPAPTPSAAAGPFVGGGDDHPSRATPAAAGGGATVRSALAAARGGPAIEARLFAFANQLNALAPGDFPALLAALQKSGGPGIAECQAMLCAVWAKHAGAEAFVAAGELARRDGNQAALQAAIAGWAEHSPAAALAALRANRLDSLAGDEMSALLRGWAAHDPEAAENHLQQSLARLPSDAETFPAAAQCGYEAAARTRISRDPAAALAWYRALDPTLQGRLRNTLVAELGTAAPALAQQWLGEDASALVSSTTLIPLLRSARLDGFAPQFDWAQHVANPTSRDAALGAIVREAAATDLVALGEWLAARGDDASLTPAFAHYAAEVVRKSPSAAITWALSLDDPALRQRTLNTVALEWSTYDSTAARRWAAESSLVDLTALMR